MATDNRRRLQLCPAPRADGPYDDETGDGPPPVVAGSLALAFPVVTRDEPALRLVSTSGRTDEAAAELARTACALPDPRVWTGRLGQAIAEVVTGARPPSQLSRFTTFDVLCLLERWAGRFATRDGRPRRPQVVSVRVSTPAAGIAEACVVLDTGERRRALALRLEGKNGRWRCTALQLG